MFRQKVKISSLFTEELFTAKVVEKVYICLKLYAPLDRRKYQFLFFFIKHYLFSVLVSHILQTKIFFNKIKINIPRKIDYLHRVLQKEIFFLYIYIYTHIIYIYIYTFKFLA